MNIRNSYQEVLSTFFIEIFIRISRQNILLKHIVKISYQEYHKNILKTYFQTTSFSCDTNKDVYGHYFQSTEGNPHSSNT
jgi:hypothetical protein